MFRIVEKNDQDNLFDEMIETRAEAEESLKSHQKHYPNIELIIVSDTVKYWNVNNINRNDISQNEANKLAELGYTMEDIRNMSDEELTDLLQNK